MLRHQVLQAQRPLLLATLAHLLLRQRPVVLQPHDVRPRVSTGCALEPHRAADGTSDHSLPHLSGLGEAWGNLKVKKEKKTINRSLLISKYFSFHLKFDIISNALMYLYRSKV